MASLDATEEFLRLASADRTDFSQHEIRRFGKDKLFDVEFAVRGSKAGGLFQQV
jgi:hypothetical protein